MNEAVNSEILLNLFYHLQIASYVGKCFPMVLALKFFHEKLNMMNTKETALDREGPQLAQ